MGLKVYADKRDLKTSKEPSAKVAKKKKAKVLHFVVQKHEASHLHYDFRLEIDGVLVSWAVPKGPSMDPAAKRLAIKVEDHPYDYKDFEGVIPKGYGAGTVMIWDYGTYHVDDASPEESETIMHNNLKKGHVSFFLEGQKLKGEFSLIQMKDRQENAWLLIKKQDAYSTSEDVLQKENSAKSKRSMTQIAADLDASEIAKPSKKKTRALSSHARHGS